MKNNDTITFIGYTIAGILLFGITFLLYKTGNEWIAKRLFYQAFPFFFGIIGTWGVRRVELLLLPKRTDHLAFFA